jgi:hypothetical protein
MPPSKPKNPYPFWSPVVLQGLRLRDWVKLLAQGRFRVHPSRLPLALTTSIYSVANEILAAVDQAAFSRGVSRTRIEHPPVFIIGHWRTGTTFLHELLSRDDRFAFPTTYECLAPHHFLLTGRVMPSLFRALAPSKRPMDDMPVGVERPQEDDIALMAMGAPTPFARVAFPDEPPPHQRLIDADVCRPEELDRWRRAMRRWVQRLTFAKGKRLLLKSPPHTGKIAELAELFPGARFIHLVRRPHDVFSSTRRLWQSLDSVYGLQIPRHDHLDEYIFTTLQRMYAAFQRQRRRLDPSTICDVAYERLVADPLGEVARIYEQFHLDDFDVCRRRMAGYLRQMEDYRPNQHALSASMADEIDRRWAGYARLHARVLEDRLCDVAV